MIKRHSLKIDNLLLLVVIVLVLFGTVVVYSASYYDLEIGFRQEAESYYQSMLFYSIIGIVAMLVISFIPYEKMKTFLPAILLVTVVSLIYVIFAGKMIKGARRWIPIGTFTFMPSELAKVALIFFIAWYVDRVGINIRDYKVLGLLIFGGISLVALVYPQKDLATILLLLALMIGMLFVSGTRFIYIAGISSFGVLAGIYFALSESYRSVRIQIWTETLFDRVYEFSDLKLQLMNSIYAISSGGIRGKGIGMSEFSNLRLPDAYSDFIFAIFSEEFGMIGGFILLLLYSFLIYRIFKIAMKCDDLFGFMIASGAGILIGLQVIINIGVALAILPTTGIPLPFISKGGTSILVLLMLVGVVLNISSKNAERRPPAKDKRTFLRRT